MLEVICCTMCVHNVCESCACIIAIQLDSWLDHWMCKYIYEMLTEVCVQDINYTSSSPTTAGKMSQSTAVFVVIACLILQAVESKNDLSLTTVFSKPVERVARSIQRRQINNCTQVQLENIFDGYPPDCPSVNLSTGLTVLTDILAGILLQSSAFCAPQCNPAIARYFSECSSGALVEVFIQFCSTNANNESCYNLTNTLVTDATTVQSSCPTSGSSCSSSCQSSILTYRNNSGCCVNVFNSSILNNFPGLATSIFAAANNNSLWVSCSVETPGFCTQSTVSRPGSLPGTTSGPNSGTTSSPNSGTTNTQYPLSKLFTWLLLGVVMVLTL